MATHQVIPKTTMAVNNTNAVSVPPLLKVTVSTLISILDVVFWGFTAKKQFVIKTLISHSTDSIERRKHLFLLPFLSLCK